MKYSKEEWNKYMRAYRAKYPEKIAPYRKAYRKKNRTKIAEYDREYQKKKYATNIQFRLQQGIRANLRYILKVNATKLADKNPIGCTVTELKFYLEGKFTDGMTWSNWRIKWSTDHILPLAVFDLTDQQQLRRACHYTNLQPLWIVDNLRKGNKLLKSLVVY